MAIEMIRAARSLEALSEFAPRLRVLRFLAGERGSVRIATCLLQRRIALPTEQRSGALAAVMESLDESALEIRT